MESEASNTVVHGSPGGYGSTNKKCLAKICTSMAGPEVVEPHTSDDMKAEMNLSTQVMSSISKPQPQPIQPPSPIPRISNLSHILNTNAGQANGSEDKMNHRKRRAFSPDGPHYMYDNTPVEFNMEAPPNTKTNTTHGHGHGNAAPNLRRLDKSNVHTGYCRDNQVNHDQLVRSESIHSSSMHSVSYLSPKSTPTRAPIATRCSSPPPSLNQSFTNRRDSNMDTIDSSVFHSPVTTEVYNFQNLSFRSPKKNISNTCKTPMKTPSGTPRTPMKTATTTPLKTPMMKTPSQYKTPPISGKTFASASPPSSINSGSKHSSFSQVKRSSISGGDQSQMGLMPSQSPPSSIVAKSYSNQNNVSFDSPFTSYTPTTGGIGGAGSGSGALPSSGQPFSSPFFGSSPGRQVPLTVLSNQTPQSTNSYSSMLLSSSPASQKTQHSSRSRSSRNSRSTQGYLPTPPKVTLKRRPIDFQTSMEEDSLATSTPQSWSRLSSMFQLNSPLKEGDDAKSSQHAPTSVQSHTTYSTHVTSATSASDSLREHSSHSPSQSVLSACPVPPPPPPPRLMFNPSPSRPSTSTRNKLTPSFPSMEENEQKNSKNSTDNPLNVDMIDEMDILLRGFCKKTADNTKKKETGQGKKGASPCPPSFPAIPMHPNHESILNEKVGGISQGQTTDIVQPKSSPIIDGTKTQPKANECDELTNVQMSPACSDRNVRVVSRIEDEGVDIGTAKKPNKTKDRLSRLDETNDDDDDDTHPPIGIVTLNKKEDGSSYRHHHVPRGGSIFKALSSFSNEKLDSWIDSTSGERGRQGASKTAAFNTYGDTSRIHMMMDDDDSVESLSDDEFDNFFLASPDKMDRSNIEISKTKKKTRRHDGEMDYTPFSSCTKSASTSTSSSTLTSKPSKKNLNGTTSFNNLKNSKFSCASFSMASIRSTNTSNASLLGMDFLNQHDNNSNASLANYFHGKNSNGNMMTMATNAGNSCSSITGVVGPSSSEAGLYRNASSQSFGSYALEPPKS